MLQWEHSAILSTFIKLPFVIKIFVLSIFEWPFYTGLTVLFNPVIILIRYGSSNETITIVKYLRTRLTFDLSWDRHQHI